ncbi:MAG TPA: tetratricopeptide repeat protein [Terriglobales bacterium]|nr:tetratricopeptide repeat protein [Terriglobales bacterium]
MRFIYLISLLLILPFVFAQSNQTQSSTDLQAPVDHPSIAHATQLFNEGKYGDAIPELQALERAPDHKGVANLLGTSYYKVGDYRNAATQLKQALTEDAGDKEATQLLGLTYYFLGRPADAIPLLSKVQSWYPRANVDASYVLGISYIRVKDYDSARKAFATMYGVPPDSAASHLFVSQMLLRQGFDPIAEEEAKKALAIDPKLPMAHFLLGELYIFKSRIPEAISEFESEMGINPAYAATYYRLADAYTRVGRYEDAERLLQRSVWLDSTASGPYILMGKVLLHKKEPDLAKRSLDRALSMDPNNYVGHYLMGQVYQAQGKTGDADNEFKLSQQLEAMQTHSPNEQ